MNEEIIIEGKNNIDLIDKSTLKTIEELKNTKDYLGFIVMKKNANKKGIITNSAIINSGTLIENIVFYVTMHDLFKSYKKQLLKQLKKSNHDCSDCDNKECPLYDDKTFMESEDS